MIAALGFLFFEIPLCAFDAWLPECIRERSMAASSTSDIAIGLPLMISLLTMPSTIVIHALAVVGIFHFIRRQHRLGCTGVPFWESGNRIDRHVSSGFGPSSRNNRVGVRVHVVRGVQPACTRNL